MTSPGQVKAQAAPLVTVTVKLQDTTLLAESVAVQLTVVVPRLKLEPEGGSQAVVTQFPVVVGLAKFTTATPESGASSPTATLPGQVIVGATGARVS